LYVAKYQGSVGIGDAVLYIGHGTVMGAGVADARYQGTFTEQASNVVGTVKMKVPAGAPMVFAQTAGGKTEFDITFQWPTNFATLGTPLPVTIEGQTVMVELEQLGPVPSSPPGSMTFDDPTKSGLLPGLMA
jgi:hypothetical protein